MQRPLEVARSVFALALGLVRGSGCNSSGVAGIPNTLSAVARLLPIQGARCSNCAHAANSPCTFCRIRSGMAAIGSAAIKQLLPLGLHVVHDVAVCHHLLARCHPLRPSAAMVNGA